MITTQLPRNVAQLQTPAPLVDAGLLAANLARMAQAWPGDRLRPHVKAHKCTELARHQRDVGHPGFTCATIREVEGMVAAGLGQDLLLANEVLDASRLGALVAAGARVTVAVDSPAIVDAAARAGVREVLIDVNVGLPRCGCSPDEAGSLAELARGAGLEVRGVMGYEGHAMIVEDRADRARQVAESMTLLERAPGPHAGIPERLMQPLRMIEDQRLQPHMTAGQHRSFEERAHGLNLRTPWTQPMAVEGGT